MLVLQSSSRIPIPDLAVKLESPKLVIGIDERK
jgi:hypothetical protein